jgi:chromosome segregation ATPase
VSQLGTKMLTVFGIVLSIGLATGLAAQETADPKACAQLLPAIESLKAMLVQEGKARAAETDTQRTQLVLTLLALRYHNIEALETSLRSAEAEETDLRGALARTQAQMEAFDEAMRSAPAQTQDPGRKAQRAEIEANLRGLEERATGLRERRNNYRGQLSLERHDIERLESRVRAWVETAP